MKYYIAVASRRAESLLREESEGHAEGFNLELFILTPEGSSC